MQNIRLYNGVEMPILGYGVFHLFSAIFSWDFISA